MAGFRRPAGLSTGWIQVAWQEEAQESSLMRLNRRGIV